MALDCELRRFDSEGYSTQKKMLPMGGHARMGVPAMDPGVSFPFP